MKTFLEYLAESESENSLNSVFTSKQVSFIRKTLKLPKTTQFIRKDPKKINFKSEEVANSKAPKFYYGSTLVWKLKDGRLAITLDSSRVSYCGFFDEALQDKQMNDPEARKSVLGSLKNMGPARQDTKPYADEETLKRFSSSPMRDSWSKRLMPSSLKTKCTDVFLIA